MMFCVKSILKSPVSLEVGNSEKRSSGHPKISIPRSDTLHCISSAGSQLLSKCDITHYFNLNVES